MSATNRGGRRVEHDFYESPRWAVRRLLEHSDQRFMFTTPGLRYVEPAAGRGHIIRCVNECLAVSNHAPNWTALEIDERHETELKRVVGAGNAFICDSLQHGTDAPVTVPGKTSVPNAVSNSRGPFLYDIAITNPPFALAFEFVSHWRPRVQHLYLLLRLGFLESEERSGYLREDEPDLYILPDRCEFAMSVKCKVAGPRNCGFREMRPFPCERPKKCPGCGGTVSIVTADSAAYSWFHWWPGQTGKYRILNSTPVEERKAGHDR